MTAYYNEIDPNAAAWLRELIAGGHIAPGVVDTTDIRDVNPDDLRHFTQCHFFAGIGGWSLALRRAGWPDDRPVWTGSCPCQPFSAAGRKGGVADERHLWPHWHYLISQCRPVEVFGEQVASKDGLGWLDLVSSDMEGHAGHGDGAPGWPVAAGPTAQAGGAGGVADLALGGRREECADAGRVDAGGRAQAVAAGSGVGSGDQRVEHANGGERGQAGGLQCGGQHGLQPQDGGPMRQGSGRLGHNAGPDMDRPGPTNGFWGAADWLGCRDGKWRPVEPGTFPLAHGVSGRVGLLRGYGNAIVPEVAAAFIEATQGDVDLRLMSDLAQDGGIFA